LATAPAPVKAEKEVSMPKLSVLLGAWLKLRFDKNNSAIVITVNNNFFS